MSLLDLTHIKTQSKTGRSQRPAGELNQIESLVWDRWVVTSTLQGGLLNAVQPRFVLSQPSDCGHTSSAGGCVSTWLSLRFQISLQSFCPDDSCSHFSTSVTDATVCRRPLWGRWESHDAAGCYSLMTPTTSSQAGDWDLLCKLTVAKSVLRFVVFVILLKMCSES